MKREALKNQTMSNDMEKMSRELAEKYHDAMVQKLLWRSSKINAKDALAYKISVVLDRGSEYYTSLTPKFFGFTFVCEDDNVYLEFLLDEEVPDGVEKRHVLFSVEELHKNTIPYDEYVAAKILNKAKEVTRHDTLLKYGYIPVFCFFVGDEERYDYFIGIRYCLCGFSFLLKDYYDAGFMYCVVTQDIRVYASEKIVPYEPDPLSWNVRNYRVVDIVICESMKYENGVYVPSGSLVFRCDFYRDYLGEAKKITLDMLLNYIKDAVVRIKEICKALNRTFDAVHVEFRMSEDCLQSIKGLNEFLNKVHYITPLETPPIFFFLRR